MRIGSSLRTWGARAASAASSSGGPALAAGLAIAVGATAAITNASLCHGGRHDGHDHHPRDEMRAMSHRLAALELERGARARYGVERTTGQGDAVFSWDERRQ